MSEKNWKIGRTLPTMKDEK